MNKKLPGPKLKANPTTRDKTSNYLKDWIYDVYPKLNNEYNCLLGDSIIEYLNHIPQLFDKHDWVINACGGDTTNHLLWRLLNIPKDKIIKKAIILIGINDIFKNKNILISMENIKEIINNINGEIIFIKVLNCNPNYDNTPEYNLRVDEYNYLLTQLLYSYPKIKLIECEKLNENDFYDQVHLNDSGNIKLINLIKKNI